MPATGTDLLTIFSLLGLRACRVFLGAGSCSTDDGRSRIVRRQSVMHLSRPILFAAAMASLGACNARSAPPQPSAPPPAASAIPKTDERLWTFDSDAIDAAPTGFSFGRTGSGRPGRWVVVAEPSGAHVLAQLDDDATDYRFPVAVADSPSARDFHLSVRCRTVSGQVDQACGLVARYRDENNYFLTRANALENNVRLYTVRDGEREQLASWSGEVTPNTWHTYRFELQGVHLEVFWDGQEVIDYRGSNTDAGRVGVWTKADSITYFDDLRAEQF